MKAQIERREDNSPVVRTISNPVELESLRPVWNSWPGTRDSDLDFFTSKLSSQGNSCHPHVLLLSRNSIPDALLVGFWERRPVRLRLGWLLTVYEAELNVLEFVYGCLRGNDSEANCAALVGEVMRSLDEGEADFALWSQLELTSELYHSAIGLPAVAFRDHSHDVTEHWFMNFPRGLGGFFMSVSRSQRSKLRRKYKKVLNTWGEKIHVRCFRFISELEQAFSEIEEIAAKSDKRMLGLGFFDTVQVRNRITAMAKNGWLRIHILYFDAKPVAFYVGTVFNRCLRAEQVGYDPAWSEFSPGIFLFLTILKDLQFEGIQTLDFGWGNTQLTRCFGEVKRVESMVEIYAPTLRGIRLNLLRSLTQRATQQLRRLEWAKRTLRDEFLRQQRRKLFHHDVRSCDASVADWTESSCDVYTRGKKLNREVRYGPSRAYEEFIF